MKCLFLGLLPTGSEWIIIALFIFIPICVYVVRSLRKLFK